MIATVSLIKSSQEQKSKRDQQQNRINKRCKIINYNNKIETRELK